MPTKALQARRRLLLAGLPIFLSLTAFTLLTTLTYVAIFHPGALLGIPHHDLSVARALEGELAGPNLSQREVARIASDFRLRRGQVDWLVTRDGKVYQVGETSTPLPVKVPKTAWSGTVLNLTFDQPPPVYQFAPLKNENGVFAVNVLDTTSGFSAWSSASAYLPLLLWTIPMGVFSFLVTLLVLGRFDAAMVGFREKMRRFGTGASTNSEPPLVLEDLDHSFELMKARVDQAREALETARREAEDAERVRAEMLADIAHAVGTPLGVVQGWLGFLSDGLVTDEDGRQRLRSKITNELCRIEQMVERLEQLSRWDETTPPSEKTRFALKEVILEVTSLLQGKAERRGLVICPNFSESLQVEADKAWTREIFQALLENVFRHAPSATRVDITAEKRGPRVWVEVVDNGDGIEPRVLKDLSTRFVHKAGGFGLGLSIAGKLAALHEGRLEVDNCPSAGARFRFSLAAGERNQEPDLSNRP